MKVKKAEYWYPVDPDGDISGTRGYFLRNDAIENFFPSYFSYKEARKQGWKIIKCRITSIKEQI